MKLVIPFLGKTKSAWIEAGIQDYAARLGRYAQLEMPVLKDPYVHGAPEERTKELQAQALLAAARGAQLLVTLDAGGMSLNSVELADLWTRWEEQGRTSVALLIGGHLGLAQSLLDRASYPLALSSLTFTHAMSRLILLEQLYRVCTIRAGHPYHL